LLLSVHFLPSLQIEMSPLSRIYKSAGFMAVKASKQDKNGGGA
jgi:hypothetical protein